MKQIKVLHYIPSFWIGGIESLFMQWHEHLQCTDITLELLVRGGMPPSEKKDQFIAEGGVCYTLAPFSAKHMWDFRKSVKAFFREHHEYDILHAHDAWDYFVFKYAKHYRIKHIILHAHSIPNQYSWKTPWTKHFLHMYRKLSKPYPDVYMACSAEVAKAQFGYKALDVKIVNNAIDTTSYAFSPEMREHMRGILGLTDAFVIGHVGRMAAEKNYPFLLQVFAAITSRRVNARLLIVGDGPLFSEIQKMAHHMKIFERILFMGARTDVASLLQAVDVVVFPSIKEGFGMVPIEAQAAGVPCLISDRLPNEVCITGLAKKMSLEESVEHWANEVLSIVSDDRVDMRSAIEQAGFDSKSQVARLGKWYREIVHGN